MIKAIKDYKESVWTPSWRWVKEHPIAYIIASVVIGAICMLPAIIDWIEYR